MQQYTIHSKISDIHDPEISIIAAETLHKAKVIASSIKGRSLSIYSDSKLLCTKQPFAASWVNVTANIEAISAVAEKEEKEKPVTVIKARKCPQCNRRTRAKNETGLCAVCSNIRAPKMIIRRKSDAELSTARALEFNSLINSVLR